MARKKSEFNKALDILEELLKSEKQTVRECVIDVLINLNIRIQKVEGILRKFQNDPNERIKRKINEYFKKERRTL